MTTSSLASRYSRNNVDQLTTNLSTLDVTTSTSKAETARRYSRLLKRSSDRSPRQRLTEDLRFLSGVGTVTDLSLSDELQLLADNFQELNLIKLISGDIGFFIPQEVAAKQSELLADLIEDLSAQFDNLHQNDQFGHITELPISNKYAEELPSYAIYLGGLNTYSHEYPKDSLALAFVKRQTLIVKKHIPVAISKVEPYLQLELASYLEDFGYFASIMDNLYEIWSKIWPQFADGPIAEVNNDIYTFTPWPYVPADLITIPSFVQDWLDRSSAKPEKLLSHNIKLDGKLECSSHFRLDKKTNQHYLDVTIRQRRDVVYIRPGGSKSYHDSLEEIRVDFYPDTLRIRTEDIDFYHPASEVVRSLSQWPLDRISEALEYQVNPDDLNKVFKMVTYWDEFGTLDRREYFIAKSKNMPLGFDSYLAHYKLLRPNKYEILTIKF